MAVISPSRRPGKVPSDSLSSRNIARDKRGAPGPWKMQELSTFPGNRDRESSPGWPFPGDSPRETFPDTRLPTAQRDDRGTSTKASFADKRCKIVGHQDASERNKKEAESVFVLPRESERTRTREATKRTLTLVWVSRTADQ